MADHRFCIVNLFYINLGYYYEKFTKLLFFSLKTWKLFTSPYVNFHKNTEIFIFIIYSDVECIQNIHVLARNARVDILMRLHGDHARRTFNIPDSSKKDK